jgi:5S rRNA maturation endonuclease (ribonuclease M5)
MADAVETFVEEIKNDGIKVKRSGRDFVMLCPFHEDNKPSLYMNVETGQWHCFGCDKAGGLHGLAAKFGKKIVRGSKSIFVSKQKKRKGEVVTYNVDDIIKDYFTLIRGFSKEQYQELVKVFNIRKASFGNEIFVYSEIKDFDWKIVGWIMRSTKKDAEKRYILKKGFEAERYFYGEWLLNKSTKNVIVVEGKFDLYKVYSSGIRNCLASLGFAGPSLKIARLIKNLKELEELVLFFDSDVKEKDLEDWKYYSEMFDRKVSIIRLKTGDPGSKTIEEIKEMLKEWVA